MRSEKPICAPSRLSEVFPTLHLKQFKSPISGVQTMLPYEAILCEQINLQTRLRKHYTASRPLTRRRMVRRSVIRSSKRLRPNHKKAVATFATNNVLLTYTTLTNRQRREQTPGTNYHNSQTKPTNLTTNGLNNHCSRRQVRLKKLLQLVTRNKLIAFSPRLEDLEPISLPDVGTVALKIKKNKNKKEEKETGELMQHCDQSQHPAFNNRFSSRRLYKKQLFL